MAQGILMVMAGEERYVMIVLEEAYRSCATISKIRLNGRYLVKNI
jgi:hypothetical protein